MELYLVRSKREYDHLMNYLEGQGYKWISGTNLSDRNYWKDNMEEMVIEVGDAVRESVSYGSYNFYNLHYPNTQIKRYIIEDDSVNSDTNNEQQVVVPQFVADWFEEHKSISLYKTLNRYLNNVGVSCELSQWQDSFGRSFKENVNAVVEVIAKMHLCGYEVEENKYYWRKKKEYLCDFENQRYRYINVDRKTREVFLDAKSENMVVKTLMTESELKQRISEEDFNKLEKVEITEE